MSRVIKFRAWIPEEKRMEYFEFHITAYGETISFGNDKPHWIIMQFTGLLDRYNVEIYEGDIIQGHPYSLHPVEVYWEQGLCSYEVRRGAWSSHCLDYSGENDIGYQPLEVIGNIWENPKLLEEK